MIRSVRRAVTLGTVALAAALGAQAASATSFLFYTSNSGAVTAGNSINYTATDGSGLTLSAYGGHLSNNSGGLAVTTGATIETYANYGMGVLYGTDSEKNGTHQIDNTGGGVDYVALVFNQAVTLSYLAVQAYGGAGVGTGTDAQFRAYSGTVADLFSGSNSLWEGYFTDPASSAVYSRGSSGNYTLDTTGITGASNIWLVAASVTQTDDAFKLLGVSVDKPAVGSVPEPASWAMIVGGFGLMGAAMRRRQRVNVSFG